jgi:hypothetical protein
VQTYEQIRGHRTDFVVRYRLLAPEDDGRNVTYQHLRCDFMYDGDDPTTDGIFMIHPEFLDAAGRPIDEEDVVPLDGKASMWILVPQMRSLHRTRIKIGTKGYFMEGPRKVGSVEVESIVALHANADA